jgi:hypothetical protein
VFDMQAAMLSQQLLERTSSRAGLAPAEVQRLSTANFFTN